MLENIDIMKVIALKEAIGQESSALPTFENAKKRNKIESEELEAIKEDGFTEFDLEMEKCIQILRSYPCLNYSIDRYLPILKRKVIGQDKILEKLLYVAYFNQYINFLEEYIDGASFNRLSLFIIGPTGCGKSTMLRALENAMNVPVHRANITSVTSAGYIGDKVESMILKLIERADGDVEAAERGILFIDEIDKKVISTTKDRDVAGKAVQQELLKLFDKGTIDLTSFNKTSYRNIKEFHTGKLTIIMAGACVGLEDVRISRLGTRKLGFSIDEDKTSKEEEYIPEDLIEYGFIPELVGRMDMIEELEEYTTSKLIDIVYFSDESSMQAYVKILETLGIDDIMIDGALWERIAEQILAGNLGVRALNNKIGKLFYPIVYESFKHVSGGRCIIEADGSYKLTYKGEDKIYTGKPLKFDDLDD